jgi:membrane protein DedA with SNARE-associated domain
MVPAVAASWSETILAYYRDHAEYAALICFVLGFGESIAFVSLFVPSTILFLGIGAAHSAAGGELWPIWLGGTLGAFGGDIVSYAVGRYFRDDVVKVWPFSKYPEFIPQARGFVDKWGMLSIIGGKFIGGLRPFLPVVAGIMDMPWAVFLIASFVSCVIWAGAFLAPSYGLFKLW